MVTTIYKGVWKGKFNNDSFVILRCKYYKIYVLNGVSFVINNTFLDHKIERTTIVDLFALNAKSPVMLYLW